MANTLHHHAQLQPKLTAGTNITIDDDNVISAAGGTAYPHITETSDTTIKFGDPANTETYATINNGDHSSLNLVTYDGLSEIKLTEKLIEQSSSISFGDIGAFSSALVIRIPFTEGSASLIFSDSNDSYFGSERVSFSFDNIKTLKRLAELSDDQIDRLISMLG